MADTKRQQLKDAESQINTRQDRNVFVHAGGTWTWDSGSGTLTWDQTVRISLGGLGTYTVAAGSVTGVTIAGRTVWIDVDRSTAGATSLTTDGTNIGNVVNSTDERLIIGIRGSDGKFYFRNGTVMSDGDSKQFGMLNSVTDRNDITANGNALQNVGFTFVAASNQLAVYVGGILQTLGVEYVETGTTQVTFQPGYIPTAGEHISFVNIIGGQGPAATGTVTLQDAWANGNTIDVRSANGVYIDTDQVSQFVLRTRYDTGPLTTTWAVRGRDGMNFNFSGEAGYAFYTNDLSGDGWFFAPLDDGGKDSLLMYGDAGALDIKGFRLIENGSGPALLECGTYAGSNYPGGTWSGSGGIAWMVETGTLNAGTPTNINIGAGLVILGVAVAFYDAGTARWQMHEYGYGLDSSRTAIVSYHPGTGNLTISGLPDGPGAPGSGIDGEAYRIVIFYQG